MGQVSTIQGDIILQMMEEKALPGMIFDKSIEKHELHENRNAVLSISVSLAPSMVLHPCLFTVEFIALTFMVRQSSMKSSNFFPNRRLGKKQLSVICLSLLQFL